MSDDGTFSGIKKGRARRRTPRATRKRRKRKEKKKQKSVESSNSKRGHEFSTDQTGQSKKRVAGALVERPYDSWMANKKAEQHKKGSTQPSFKLAKYDNQSGLISASLYLS